MMFRGQRWTRSKKVVALPHKMWPGEHNNYVGFARVCSKDTPGAVKTKYEWTEQPTHDEEGNAYKSSQGDPPEQKEDGSWYFPVYAVPVKGRSDALGEDHPTKGYGLTNLLYGADGFAYLMENGKFYVRRWRKSKQKV